MTVIADQWGIPHIYADSVNDAFMVLGYLHARDRLFQMVMQSRLASGRLSEIIGPAAVTSDKFYRTIGLRRSAELTHQWYLEHRSDPIVDNALSIVEAEVEGVNAFIDSMTSAVTPIEFKLLGLRPEPWTELDVFVWAKMMTWGLSGNFRDLYRQYIRAALDNDTLYRELFNDTMPFTVPIVPEQTNLSLAEFPLAPGGAPAPAIQSGLRQSKVAECDVPFTRLQSLLDRLQQVMSPFGPGEIVGSNNWVVSGNKSATGHPILANDPHLVLQAPSLWYEAHIVVPGELDVMGVTFPGLPGVVLGHTAHAAWGFTNVGADVLDIVVEKVNPDNSSQYEYNGQWKDFEIVDEQIRLRDGTIVPFSVKWSVHGPLIDSFVTEYGVDESSAENIAMMWTGNGVTHEVLSLSLMNKMNTIEDYHRAVYWWDSPPQNIVFADDQANIAIMVAGRFPIRSGYSGEFPVQLLNDTVGWVSNIPFAHNPRSVNPS